MLIKNILQLLYNVSIEEEIPAFICGGIPRDKIIGNLAKSFNDIDITSGNSNVFNLAKEFNIELNKYTKTTTKQAIDGHVSVYLKNFKIDFSSNFNVPNIDNILHQRGIKNPSSMLKELYSRDFTCNTLLMSLDLKKIKDLTGEAVKDINNKIIKTCLTPELTFKYNTNRIIRVIYLACKLDFDVDPYIIEWIKNNKKYMLQSEQSYISKNIDKSIKLNADKTIYLLDKMNLWNVIPITNNLYPYFANKNLKDFANV